MKWRRDLRLVLYAACYSVKVNRQPCTEFVARNPDARGSLQLQVRDIKAEEDCFR
jgi:hypothetical protein